MIYLQLLWVYLKIGTFGFGDFANDTGADWN